jgi:hypothetical protein
MDKKYFRKYGYQFVDWLVDYFENIETLPVKPILKPGDVRKTLPKKTQSRVSLWTVFFKIFKKSSFRVSHTGSTPPGLPTFLLITALHQS